MNTTLPSVLLVEDDPLSAGLVRAYLKDMCEVDWTSNAYEVLNLLTKNFYSLILMDIHLTGIDGIEILRQIKSLEYYKNIPVIAVTAFNMHGDREKFLKAGFTDYIPKPVKRDILTETVAAYLYNISRK